MPELPEVETVKNALAQVLEGRLIESTILRQGSLRKLLAKKDLDSISGLKILSFSRRAKYIIIHLEDDKIILAHLGMTGSFRVVPQDEEFRKHEHLSFELDNGQSCRYEDPRRFGSIEILTSEDCERALQGLGPEPLSDDFSVDYLWQATRKRRKPVKTFIMDNPVVVGVGNIYASEALFMAGIKPQRLAQSLKKKEVIVLRDKIREVLLAAIAAGGTTISDFKSLDGQEGYFFRALQVYGREGDECLSCHGSIQKLVMAGRSTFFCPKCQR